MDLMEPVRSARGPVLVHSGFRYPELNKTVGGSPVSQHCAGQACDFNVVGRFDPALIEEDFQWIWRRSGLKVHQLIYENTWIHISLPTGDNDGQILRYSNGAYTRVA